MPWKNESAWANGCCRGTTHIISLHKDPHFNVRFAEARIVPRFHLEGVLVCRQVSVFKIDSGTGERLGWLATEFVGADGCVDLAEPIIVRARDAVVAVPDSTT